MTTNTGSSQKDISYVNIQVLNFKRKMEKSTKLFTESLGGQNSNRNKHTCHWLASKHHHRDQLIKRCALKMATDQAFQEQAINTPIILPLFPVKGSYGDADI